MARSKRKPSKEDGKDDEYLPMSQKSPPSARKDRSERPASTEPVLGKSIPRLKLVFSGQSSALGENASPGTATGPETVGKTVPTHDAPATQVSQNPVPATQSAPNAAPVQPAVPVEAQPTLETPPQQAAKPDAVRFIQCYVIY
jgi:hypothetical protein